MANDQGPQRSNGDGGEMSSAEPQPRILIYAPSPAGGLTEHIHYQAGELVRRGYDVRVLCRRDFCKPIGSGGYRQERRLFRVGGASRIKRILRAVAAVVNYYVLAWRIVRLRPGFVLLEANAEFRALAWFLPHWLLRLTGTIYLANFHDPLRGPERGLGRWIHGLNIRLAYAALSGGLIHAPVPSRAYLPRRLVIREAPFGPYADLAGKPLTFTLRDRFDIPEGDFVVLAFGHIADRKNLDLLIAALADVPGAHLVIAGQAVSQADRPLAFYRETALRRGVGDRVHFAAGFILEADIPAYFAAADAAALTYSRAFVSQSGVLQIAALFGRPLLASGGQGPLRETVERFGLGVTVEPDSVAAIAAGLRRLMADRSDLSENFAGYRATTSWEVNVDRLLEVVAVARRRAD